MKTIEEYRAAAMAYTVVVTAGEDDLFVARAVAFPAALGTGDTPAEAAAALTESIAAGLEHLDYLAEQAPGMSSAVGPPQAPRCCPDQ